MNLSHGGLELYILSYIPVAFLVWRIALEPVIVRCFPFYFIDSVYGANSQRIEKNYII